MDCLRLNTSACLLHWLSERLDHRHRVHLEQQLLSWLLCAHDALVTFDLVGGICQRERIWWSVGVYGSSQFHEKLLTSCPSCLFSSLIHHHRSFVFDVCDRRRSDLDPFYSTYLESHLYDLYASFDYYCRPLCRHSRHDVVWKTCDRNRLRLGGGRTTSGDGAGKSGLCRLHDDEMSCDGLYPSPKETESEALYRSEGMDVKTSQECLIIEKLEVDLDVSTRPFPSLTFLPLCHYLSLDPLDVQMRCLSPPMLRSHRRGSLKMSL